MAEQNKKDNTGYLNPNSNKTKPTHPDHVGTIIIEGKEYRLAAWENKKADGTTYLSIRSSLPLTPEQQSQFKRTDEPQAAPSNNSSSNSNNSNNHNDENSQKSGNNQEYDYDNFSSDLDDDLNAILRSSDDDNPFN